MEVDIPLWQAAGFKQDPGGWFTLTFTTETNMERDDHQREMQQKYGAQAEPQKPVLKYDVGKSPVWRGVLSYFPRALAKIAGVSDYGAMKYAWNAWRKVQDANRMERYADAMVRHQLSVAKEGWRSIDPETGHLHLAHLAWNCLALLELTVEEAELKKDGPVNGAEMLARAGRPLTGSDRERGPRPGSTIVGDRFGPAAFDVVS